MKDGNPYCLRGTKKKNKTKENVINYDIMNSDIEDDGNATANKTVAAPDQEAGVNVDGNENGTEEIIKRADTDVRKFFDSKLKDDEGTKTSDTTDKNLAKIQDGNSQQIKDFDKNLSAQMTKIGNDLTKKYTSSFEEQINDKLAHMLINFEKKLDSIMKSTMETYHTTPDFKRHEEKILKHIDTKVGNQFNTRVGLQFKSYTEDFDKASKTAKYELREATNKMKTIKSEYTTMKTKFETSKVTLIDTVKQELENIGDDTICNMLTQKDIAIMDINSELQDHQDNLQSTARKVESMTDEVERLEIDMQLLSNMVSDKNKEPIVITESDIDSDEKDKEKEKLQIDYWKIPHDDLYLKFIDGKIEEGKPLYEYKGAGLYIRVADVNDRKKTQGKTDPHQKPTMFTEAARRLGHNDDDDEKDCKPAITTKDEKPPPSPFMTTSDGQGGSTQVFSFDYYTFPKGHTRRLDTFKAAKVTLSDVSSTAQLPTLYMQLKHNLTQHGILLPNDPSQIDRWENQREPPTIPYTVEDFKGDDARYQHIRTHSATTLYALLKGAVDDDWVQGQNILLTEEQCCDGYAVLYRLLALTMPKLRDIDDIHSLREPVYTTEDTPVTFANKIANWRQQKQFENETMTESNCFTYLITRIPREIYEEGLRSIEKTYASYKSDHNYWSLHGKHGHEPQYPRACKLSEAGVTIMNTQIAYNEKMGKVDAIVRKATAHAGKIIEPDNEMEFQMDQCTDIPTIHAASAKELVRPRADVTCRACNQWGHCIELGGQCDFLAQHINCQHYIRNNSGEKQKHKLKEAVVNYEERQKDRRRVMTNSGGSRSRQRNDANTPQRGRNYERSRSPYSQQRRPRTPSSVRGVAKSANATSVTFQEEDMPYGFDDSNVLFAEDESYYDTENESNQEE